MNENAFVLEASRKTSGAAYNIARNRPRLCLEPTGPTTSCTSHCRETGTEVVSINAEHDICNLLTVKGWPNGPVQFWCGSTPSLAHASIRKMGRYRIAFREQFPQRVRRKDGRHEILSESVAGSPQNRETEAAQVHVRRDGGRP